MSDTDVFDTLEQEIEEFHKLRDDSRRLIEQAQWPDAQTPRQDEASPDPVEAPEVPARKGDRSGRRRECR